VTNLAGVTRRVDRALIITLSDTLSGAGSADATQALLAASTAGDPPTPLVLDLRDVDLVTVHLARTLVAFAHARADRAVTCVLLTDPGHTAANVVLDSVDPDVSVPRFATLEQAVAAYPTDRPADPAGRAGPADSTPGGSVNTLAFDSTDLGRTEEFLSASFAPMRIASTTGRTDVHIARVAIDTVSADQVDLGIDLSYDVQALGRICLCDIHTGTVSDHRADGWPEAEAFGSGELFSVAPPDRGYTGRISRARCDSTMFDAALLDLVAGAERPVRLLDHRPLDAAAAGRVRRAIAHLRDDVLPVPGVGESPLVVSTASRYLAATVLNAFPNTAHTDPDNGAERDSHPAALRRAVVFIEANADRDIGLTDIARAARVSARSVQLAFRRHLDMTPTAYLRRVRVGHARTELRSAAPGETTVARVAARWGYVHPSVFAAHYRSIYGESPSQTLRQGAAGAQRVRFPGRPRFAHAAPRTVGDSPTTSREHVAATPGPDSDVAVEGAPAAPGQADPIQNQFEPVTRTLLTATTVDDALQRIVEAARLLVPGADLVGVTVRAPDGSCYTPARTDEIASELDQIQHQAGSGPGLDVAGPGGPGYVASDDLHGEPRWPRFAAAATSLGYGAVIAIELFPTVRAGRISVVLSIYSRRSHGLSRADRRTALLLASHASLALAYTHTTELADIQQKRLLRAIDTRDIIGQAKGILMHRRGITADEAYDVLLRTSQDLNVKLVDLARALNARHSELDQS
jgi:AraC-like DNA-binding protein